MKRINGKGIELIVYEPTLEDEHFFNSKVIHDLNVFKQTADIIIANRMNAELQDVKDKIFSRDVYGLD